MRSLIVAAAALMIGAGGSREASPPSGGMGAITGKVLLDCTLPDNRMEVSQDHKTCGRSKRSPRICVGKSNGIADAIVYLEKVKGGKSFPQGQAYTLEQHNCEYTPHILIVPAGSCMEIVNNDAILHNVHTYEGAQDPKTLFNIAQPVKGLRSKTRPLTTPGIKSVSCDAGHPWMSAYVMVADHPYYALTDKDGNFRLDGVPPGTYTLHMWHEGVGVTRSIAEHDKVKQYFYEPPYEETREVTVEAGGAAEAEFRLKLR